MVGKKSTYSNYNNPRYRTKKYSNSRLRAFRHKNEAAMKAGKELAEQRLNQPSRYIKVKQKDGTYKYIDRLLGYEKS